MKEKEKLNEGTLRHVVSLVNNSTSRVWSISWHPFLPILASCGQDRLLNLWYEVSEPQYNMNLFRAFGNMNGQGTKDSSQKKWKKLCVFGRERKSQLDRKILTAPLQYKDSLSIKDIYTGIDYDYLYSSESETEEEPVENSSDEDMNTSDNNDLWYYVHSKSLRCVAWSKSGTFLAVASFDGKISIWRPTCGHISIYNNVNYTNDSSLVPNINEPNQYKTHTDNNNHPIPLVNLARWRCIGIVSSSECEVKAVSWKCNDESIASCNRDRSVWIHDISVKNKFKKEILSSLNAAQNEENNDIYLKKEAATILEQIEKNAHINLIPQITTILSYINISFLKYNSLQKYCGHFQNDSLAIRRTSLSKNVACTANTDNTITSTIVTTTDEFTSKKTNCSVTEIDYSSAIKQSSDSQDEKYPIAELLEQDEEDRSGFNTMRVDINKQSAPLFKSSYVPSTNNSIIRSDGQKKNFVIWNEKCKSMESDTTNRHAIKYAFNELNISCCGMSFKHEKDVKCILFHPFISDIFFTSSYDTTVFVWKQIDKQEWDVTAELTQHESTVWSLDVSPCGTCIVTCSHDFTLRLWQAELVHYASFFGNKTQWEEILGAEDADSFAVKRFVRDQLQHRVSTPNSSLFEALENVTMNSSQYLNLRPVIVDMEKWSCTDILKHHDATIYCVSWNKILPLIASAGGDNCINIYSYELEGESRKWKLVLQKKRAHYEDVNCIDWRPPGVKLEPWQRIIDKGCVSIHPKSVLKMESFNNNLYESYPISQGYFSIHPSKDLLYHFTHHDCQEEILYSHNNHNIDIDLDNYNREHGENLCKLCLYDFTTSMMLATGGDDGVISIWQYIHCNKI